MDTSKLMALMKDKKAALKQKSKTLKPNPGKNNYVLLPGWRKGDEHIFQHEFGQHFIKNAAGEIQSVYPCLDATYGRPCPICDSIAKAIRMTDDEDVVKQLEEATAGIRKQKFLLNVLALDSDEPGVPQILEVGKQVFGQIVEMVEEWAAGIFDSEEPQIIQISRDGKGLNTKYTVQISPKKHTMPKGVMAKLNNLDEYVQQENEAAQTRALTAINNVAGLLVAPTGADKPKTATSTLARDEGHAEAAHAAATRKPAKADVALDDELDDLLGDLGE
jgi:hypothetical protein